MKSLRAISRIARERFGSNDHFGNAIIARPSAEAESI